jgi:hypothetical protein
VRDWVVRFNGCGPDDLIGRKAPGQLSQLKDGVQARSPAPPFQTSVWVWDPVNFWALERKRRSQQIRALTCVTRQGFRYIARDASSFRAMAGEDTRSS